MYNDEMRIGEFLTEPHIAVVKALLLQFQPTYLDILPLYIVLLAVFPLVLVALRWQPRAVVAASLTLYVAVQVENISVPAYPTGREWYFNPLAWQFLFVAGAALGLEKDRLALPPRWKRWLLRLAAVIIAFAGVVRLSWTIHGLLDPIPGIFLAALWPVDKTDLSPIRLVSFLAAVAIVALLIPAATRSLNSRLARSFILCGRHSLEIFCLGILLSVLGHFILSEYDPGLATQIAVNATGIITMCLVAKLIDWYRQIGRAPALGPIVDRAARPG